MVEPLAWDGQYLPRDFKLVSILQISEPVASEKPIP
jgi:hypothetical protein